MASGGITVRADLKALQRTAAQFRGFEAKVPQILSRAINRTIQKGHTKTIRLISEEITATKRDIRKATTIRKRATRANLEGVFALRSVNLGPTSSARVGRLGLSKYKARQIGAPRLKTDKETGQKRREKSASWGVTYKIGKSGGRQKIREPADSSPSPPFITTVGAGHKGVFRRRTRNPNSGIFELYGPSVSHVGIKDPRTNKFWDRTLVNRIYLKEVDSQIGVAIQELLVAKYKKLSNLSM